MSGKFDSERLSTLIGDIYDCAVDPSRWEATLATICSELEFLHAMLGVYRQPAGFPFNPLLRIAAGLEPVWLERQFAYGPDMNEYWGGVEKVQTFPLEEPIVASQARDKAVSSDNRFVSDWLAPQGICDLVGPVLARDQFLFSSITFAQHKRAGIVTEGKLTVLRMLAPHLRRAIAIGNLLDMKTAEAATFADTLESLAVGTILVNSQNQPIHANLAARAMLEASDTVRVEHGQLKLESAEASSALAAAVTRAATDESCIGRSGIAIPARRKDGGPSVLHVMPLMRGEIRPGLARNAAAAVFIAPAASPPQMPAAALAILFDLTPSETRVLELIVDGRAPAEISSHLGISLNTVKTHLQRVFQKTGVSRQSDLARLVASLSI